MLDLTLSVLCSSLIFVIFKLFDTYKVQTLYAIVVNYITACVTGLLLYPAPIFLQNITAQSWFGPTAALGILFILIFNIMAKSSQINGVGVTSVATKMSLVIPVLFAVLFYKDVLSTWQVLGVFLALGAVYLASIKKKGTPANSNFIWLPIVVFLGSGIIDTSIKYIQDTYLQNGQYPIFSSTVFGAAATTGLLFIVYKSIRGSFKVNFRNIVGGICLGVPNYFSIYFLLRALNHDSLNSASVFTINNVAIVMFSTILGILLFKERLSTKNWIGILVAIISILLVALF